MYLTVYVPVCPSGPVTTTSPLNLSRHLTSDPHCPSIPEMVIVPMGMQNELVGTHMFFSFVVRVKGPATTPPLATEVALH